MVAATLSSPTDSATSSMLATKRQELITLDTQKKSLMSEAEAIVSELTAQLPDGVSFWFLLMLHLVYLSFCNDKMLR